MAGRRFDPVAPKQGANRVLHAGLRSHRSMAKLDQSAPAAQIDAWYVDFWNLIQNDGTIDFDAEWDQMVADLEVIFNK